MYLAIEGVIGVGKTSLARLLQVLEVLAVVRRDAHRHAQVFGHRVTS